MTVSPPRDIVRVVRSELATPGRYNLHPHVRSAPSWEADFISWLGNLITTFVNAITKAVHIGATGTSIIGDILLVATLLLVGFVAARLLMALQIERDRIAEASALTPARSAQALARAAAECAEAADYNRAIRLLFSAAIVLLDLRGIVIDDESATINQLRRELRTRASEADVPFAEIASAYTSAAYAERAADEAAWLKAHTAYGKLSGGAA